ncbi:hypothetical protein MYXO_01839 [Myxococcaceae bacterium]|nr:hypothetical protein MYXO_01839 [Myxococcaceae bacterium]
MEENRCRWCAEPVAEQALRCPHCASRLEGGLRDPRPWHRAYPERKIAGVCCAVAENLGVSVSLVRAAFLLLAFFHGVGLLLYAALWFVMPDEPGGTSGSDRLLEAFRTLFGETPSRRGRAVAARGEDDRDSDSWSPTRN